MRIGKIYNAHEVLKEMDLFLKELRLSGYKVRDIRDGLGGWPFLMVHVTEETRIGAFLLPSGHHTAEYHEGKMGVPGGIHRFNSTEELEEIIMEFIHEH